MDFFCKGGGAGAGGRGGQWSLWVEGLACFQEGVYLISKKV